MRAAGLGSHHATSITVGMFAMGTMVSRSGSRSPSSSWPGTRRAPSAPTSARALPLLALSLAVPLTAADTATSTRLTLAALHLIAGAIIIPVVARRLSRPR
jgi:hypothetical protein